MKQQISKGTELTSTGSRKGSNSSRPAIPPKNTKPASISRKVTRKTPSEPLSDRVVIRKGIKSSGIKPINLKKLHKTQSNGSEMSQTEPEDDLVEIRSAKRVSASPWHNEFSNYGSLSKVETEF